MTPDSAIILIGMPAAGKSTVGALLAKTLGRRFVDTDDLIVEKTGRSLQSILEADGYLRLRAIEEEVILAADFSGAIVATGGSAVYSDAAMRHLAGFGELVFLDISLPALKARLGNFGERGIASAPGDDLEAVYADRLPRYASVAARRIDVEGLRESEVLNAVLAPAGKS